MLILGSFLMLFVVFATVFGYFELLISQIQNGATFIKIDKVDIAKDNSPALVFQGILPLYAFVMLFSNRGV